jgi:hypothetical protein
MRHASKSTRAAPADQLSFIFSGEQAKVPSIEQRARTEPPKTAAPIAEVVKTTRPALPRLKPVRARVPTPVGPEDRRLTVDEAADVLAVSVKTLEAWRRLGKGPVFVKLGRSVRYTMRALDDFTRDRTVKNSAEGRTLDMRR